MRGILNRANQTRGLAKKAGGFKGSNKGKGGVNRKGEGGEGKGVLESLNRFVEVAEEAKRYKPDFTGGDVNALEGIRGAVLLSFYVVVPFEDRAMASCFLHCEQLECVNIEVHQRLLR